jgi:hypothetical protein
LVPATLASEGDAPAMLLEWFIAMDYKRNDLHIMVRS